MIAQEKYNIANRLPENLSDESRVWIYQAESELTEKEVSLIQKACKSFVPAWQAHGKNLQADCRILFNRFLCLFVDESAQGATGCSIDSSVHFIQDLEKQLGKSLMMRTQVIFLDDEGQLNEVDMHDMPSRINSETPVFNNLVKTLGEMKTNWIIPAGQSWHSRML